MLHVIKTAWRSHSGATAGGIEGVGEWLQWLKSLPMPQQTAWRYMAVYDNRDIVKAKLNTVFNLHAAYKLISGKQHTPNKTECIEVPAEPPAG